MTQIAGDKSLELVPLVALVKRRLAQLVQELVNRDCHGEHLARQSVRTCSPPVFLIAVGVVRSHGSVIVTVTVERAVRHGFHPVHSSLHMPTDEAAYDIAVVVAANARERGGGPIRVADGELVASRQGAVLDQQIADVVACAACSWQLVEFLG